MRRAAPATAYTEICNHSRFTSQNLGVLRGKRNCHKALLTESYINIAPFASEKTAENDAGDGEDGNDVSGKDHEPRPPGVVGEQHQHTGHQVKVTNRALKKEQTNLINCKDSLV